MKLMKDNIFTQLDTPSYLIKLDEFEKHVVKVKSILGESISLCYSMKANPFLTETASKNLNRIEVCSPGEFKICQRLRVPASKIIYSGVNKEVEEIEVAMRYGVTIFTAESLKHAKILSEISEKLKHSIQLLIRLSSGNQFGMSEEDLLRTINLYRNHRYVKIIGIHYYGGTQRNKFAQQEKDLELLLKLKKLIFEKYNYEVTHLEYGPGLSVPLFEGDNTDDIYNQCQRLSELLKSYAEWSSITIEMGRFLATFCGYYLTRVMDLKNSENAHYAIVDGGIHHLNYYGQMMGMKHPYIDHLHTSNVSEKAPVCDWTICGSLCTTADVIVRKYPLQDLKENDILVFSNAGAYSITEGIFMFLSRRMPKVYTKDSKNIIKLIRRDFDTSILNCSMENE